MNRSEWTGRDQTTILSLTGRWSAKVSFEVKVEESEFLELEAFRVDLKGRVNALRLPATIKPQFQIAMPLQVNGAGQTGYSLAVKNGPPGVVIKRGHKITVGDQLAMVMTSVTIDGSGHATLTLSNPPRRSPADGTAIEAVDPTCLVKLSNPAAGWTSSYPEILQLSDIEVEETFV
jgi:hypothetical protein